MLRNLFLFRVFFLHFCEVAQRTMDLAPSNLWKPKVEHLAKEPGE